MATAKCIVLIGPPCSGKSTVGRFLADKLGYRYVSSGDIARNMGKAVNAMLRAGRMAPEDEMREEIKKILDTHDDVILDGFPRFEDQYNWMMGKFMHRSFSFVLIDAPVSIIFDRVSKRGREDDVSMTGRFEYYRNHTTPMVSKIMKDDPHQIMHTMNINSITMPVMEIERWLHDCRRI